MLTFIHCLVISLNNQDTHTSHKSAIIYMHNTDTPIEDSDEEDAVESHVLDLPPSPLPSKRPATSNTSDHDVSVFRDIEAEVDDASDIVCNGGLDIGDMIFEHDETNNEEQRRIARFLTSGCSCKLLDGIPCSNQFAALMLQEARDECRQLTREQLDVVVMGQLRALCHRDPLTQKNKARHSERKRTCTSYHFQGYHVCRDTFVFLHTISIARLKALKQHWMENRMCPRGRAKVLPHNTAKLSDIKNVVLQYAEDRAILLPGRIPGYKRDDLQLLPSSTTKRKVWKLYHCTASAVVDTKAVGYPLFCTFWRKLTPHVVVTRPTSDLCWVCQQNSNMILQFNHRPMEEKSEV